MNLLEALSLDPNEANRQEHLDFGNNTNKKDLLELINNDDPIDLLTIQANKILNDIKRMIGIKLKEERIKEIDDNFITSLKKMIIICNNEISKEYLTELSYVYYATYNNTLNLYYEMTETRNRLYYFMLEEKFYNSVNIIDEYDWSRYDPSTLEMLELSYRNGIFDQMIEILKINPDFNVMGLAETDNILKKEYFNELIDTFGLEGVAKGNFATIVYAIDEVKDYVKELRTINPNIIFDDYILVEKAVINNFDIQRIAFFTEEDKRYLNKASEETSISGFNMVCGYYNKLLDYIEDDNHRDFIDEYGVIEYLALNNSLPPELYFKLTSDEIEELDELIKSHLNKLHWSEFSFGEGRNINSFIKKLTKKYGNQKIKKLKR